MWVFLSFCILTPTAGSCDSVIAALAHSDTSFSREVAQETGEEQGEERHSGPADAAVRLCAREGLVGASVLVVTGAVVEKPLDAADACPVFHHVLRRAHAPTATQPAGRKRTRATALWTTAPTAVLTLVGVFTLIFWAPAAWHSHHGPGPVVQGFQLFWIELCTFGLGSDYLGAACRAAEEPLAWRRAPHAGPDATLGVLCAGGPYHALPGRNGIICVSMLSQWRQIAEIIRPLFLSLLLPVGPGAWWCNQVTLLLPVLRGRGPLGHRGPFWVLIATSSNPDLIQRKHYESMGQLPVGQARIWRSIMDLRRPWLWSPFVMLPVRRVGRWRRPPAVSSSSPIAVALTSGIHLGTEGPLWLAWDTSEVRVFDTLAPV